MVLFIVCKQADVYKLSHTLVWTYSDIGVIIIIISFISLALKGIHKRLGLYKVLTHSQGNLEAKGEPRATNTGQIKYRKTYSKAGLEPQATRRPVRRHTWWSSLERPPKGQILTGVGKRLVEFRLFTKFSRKISVWLTRLQETYI